MSSPLLKFEAIKRDQFDPAVLAAAVEALPHPLAVSENGKVIYANRNFAQLASTASASGRSEIFRGAHWQITDFLVAGREFSLTTARDQNRDAEHQQIVGRLVAGVAHDFNNLLTGVILYCDLLQLKTDASSPLWKRVSEIRSAAEQGAALIRQLMTLGREDQGEPRSVSFNGVVCELEFLLRHLLGEHIDIVTNLADDPGLVGISAAQAQQIILNLALNARDAMPGGGQLRFESQFRPFEGTSSAARIFEFTVSDTGHGMDGQTASHAFDLFFTTKAAGHGTGTGLATVRKIVEDAGGIVCVETSLGKGTRMIVRLPEIASGSQPVDLQAPPASMRANQRGDSQ